MATTKAKENAKNVVTVNFVPEKITKNTVRFAEKLESEYAAPVVGTIYVPKATLGQVGYTDGKELVVSITVG